MALIANKNSRFMTTMLLGFVSILIVSGIVGFFLFFEGERPAVTLKNAHEFIGQKGSIEYTVSDNRSGIRSIIIQGVQGDISRVLHSVSFPRASFIGKVGPARANETVTFDTIKNGFVDGPMRLRVEVTDYSLRWLRGNTTIIDKEMTVDTLAPRLQILQSEKYISPGGAGIAIYRLSEEKSTSGVTVNGRFHPGFPLGDGKMDSYISYFALPYDSKEIEGLHVSAIDLAGNETIVPFTTVYKATQQKVDTITISENFLASKIPEFQQHYPAMKGELVDQYLYTNSAIRDQNNTKISELCRNPSSERLWQGAFGRMAGSPRAGFADHRSYVYNGKIIDNQVHLGVDIASTAKAEVRAANKGKVVFADYLGIYGNMILIDHGQGIFSLYSHLSQMNSSPGDVVDKTTIIGLTGTSGMAGGDHLHFAILVNGIFVMPKEWWDEHWIAVTIEAPLTLSKF